MENKRELAAVLRHWRCEANGMPRNTTEHQVHAYTVAAVRPRTAEKDSIERKEFCWMWLMQMWNRTFRAKNRRCTHHPPVLFVWLTHLFFFLSLRLSFTCRVIKKKRDREKRARLISSLTYSPKSPARLSNVFSSVSHRRWTPWRVAFWDSPHRTPAEGGQWSSRPTGAETQTTKKTDYWPLRKCLAKLYSCLSFLPPSFSGLVQWFSACVYTGWLFRRPSLPLHPEWEISIVCVAAHFMLRFPHLFPEPAKVGRLE